MTQKGPANDQSTTWQDVLHFWFDLGESSWWEKDLALDRLITERYSTLHQMAFRGELFEWRRDSGGRLAEIIVLDQFSRHMFRGTADAFASDPMALVLAQEAVARGVDLELISVQRTFLYLPYMHSESIRIHEVAVPLYTKNALPESLDFELQHQRIIERFGRYPHRNEALGRESTAEELEFLKQPGSSF